MASSPVGVYLAEVVAHGSEITGPKDVSAGSERDVAWSAWCGTVCVQGACALGGACFHEGAGTSCDRGGRLVLLERSGLDSEFDPIGWGAGWPCYCS